VQTKIKQTNKGQKDYKKKGPSTIVKKKKSLIFFPLGFLLFSATKNKKPIFRQFLNKNLSNGLSHWQLTK
jgi:hypothetical protein